MYHAFFLLEELSTPFLNAKNLYPSSSRAYKIWAVLFALSFFLCRGFFGLTYSTTTYWCLFTFWSEHHAQPSLWMDACIFLQFFSFSVSRLLNVYWMGLIANKILAGDKPKKKITTGKGGAAAIVEPLESPTAAPRDAKKLQ
jgi:hypothetical protein